MTENVPVAEHCHRWILGELLKIEGPADRFGRRLEQRFGGGAFTKGFVTASLVYCGAMAIMGL